MFLIIALNRFRTLSVGCSLEGLTSLAEVPSTETSWASFKGMLPMESGSCDSFVLSVASFVGAGASSGLLLLGLSARSGSPLHL